MKGTPFREAARQMLSADALASLLRDGHVRLQAKFMPPHLAKDALHFFRSGHCKDGAAGRGRGDKVVWLSLASIPETLPALSNAFALLMNIVCELEEQLSEGLFVPLYCQFAAYEGDGVACYPPHRDNSPLPDGQDWLNDRTYTVLCYLNEDWSAADEGELRIHPLASDAERTRLEWNGGRDAGGGMGPCVDIAPTLGTICIFRSELLHEVLPTRAGRARLALTMWALSRKGPRGPEDGFEY